MCRINRAGRKFRAAAGPDLQFNREVLGGVLASFPRVGIQCLFQQAADCRQSHCLNARTRLERREVEPLAKVFAREPCCRMIF